MVRAVALPVQEDREGFGIEALADGGIRNTRTANVSLSDDGSIHGRERGYALSKCSDRSYCHPNTEQFVQSSMEREMMTLSTYAGGLYMRRSLGSMILAVDDMLGATDSNDVLPC